MKEIPNAGTAVAVYSVGYIHDRNLFRFFKSAVKKQEKSTPYISFYSAFRVLSGSFIYPRIHYLDFMQDVSGWGYILAGIDDDGFGTIWN